MPSLFLTRYMLQVKAILQIIEIENHYFWKRPPESLSPTKWTQRCFSWRGFQPSSSWFLSPASPLLLNNFSEQDGNTPPDTEQLHTYTGLPWMVEGCMALASMEGVWNQVCLDKCWNQWSLLEKGELLLQASSEVINNTLQTSNKNK